MQQLPPSAYMPQQWPIPPLWNTSGNWYNGHNGNMALPPEWHVNMWRAQNAQQQPTALLGHNHVASATAPHMHGQMLSRQIAQLNSPASAIVTPAHVTKARPGPIATPTTVTKLLARADTSTRLEELQTELVAASIRPPSASSGRAILTSLQLTAQPRLLQKDPHVKPVTEAIVIAEPTTTAAAAASAPSNDVIPSSKRATLTTGPARRGHGNTCVTRGELCALAALKEIFPGKVFEKVRPEWLINDRTGRLLEIDLYNHELRFGVEHSGQSHYVFPNSLHKTRAEFDAQVYRDKLKLELCAKFGVLLVVAPFTVPHGAMETYIRSEIDRLSSD